MPLPQAMENDDLVPKRAFSSFAGSASNHFLASHLTAPHSIRQHTRQPSPPSNLYALQAGRFGSKPSRWRIQPDVPRPSPPTRVDTQSARPPSLGTMPGWRQLGWPACCLTKEGYRRLVVADIGFSISRGRRRWACGRRAPAVGNARRAAPALSTVGARCAEGASSICPRPAGREAPGPRGLASLSARFDFKAQAACSTTLRNWPRTRSFAFSARQALMRRCSVRSCALLA